MRRSADYDADICMTAKELKDIDTAPMREILGRMRCDILPCRGDITSQNRSRLGETNTPVSSIQSPLAGETRNVPDPSRSLFDEFEDVAVNAHNALPSRDVCSTPTEQRPRQYVSVTPDDDTNTPEDVRENDIIKLFRAVQVGDKDTVDVVRVCNKYTQKENVVLISSHGLSICTCMRGLRLGIPCRHYWSAIHKINILPFHASLVNLR